MIENTFTKEQAYNAYVGYSESFGVEPIEFESFTEESYAAWSKAGVIFASYITAPVSDVCDIAA